MNKGQFHKSVGADGKITLTYWSYQAGRPVIRTFESTAGFAAWWNLNSSKFQLVEEVQLPECAACAMPTIVHGAEHTSTCPAVTQVRAVNERGVIAMANERAWLDANAAWRIGSKARFHARGHHIGNNTIVTVVAYSMDHSHGSPADHTSECWNHSHIMYDVAIGHNQETDTATLRWNARANELFKLGE